MLVLAGLINVLKDPVQTIKWMVAIMIFFLLLLALRFGGYFWFLFGVPEFFYMLIWFLESTRGKTWYEVFTSWGTKPGYQNLMEV